MGQIMQMIGKKLIAIADKFECAMGDHDLKVIDKQFDIIDRVTGKHGGVITFKKVKCARCDYSTTMIRSDGVYFLQAKPESELPP